MEVKGRSLDIEMGNRLSFSLVVVSYPMFQILSHKALVFLRFPRREGPHTAAKINKVLLQIANLGWLLGAPTTLLVSCLDTLLEAAEH